jgi:Na+/citrate or Na+/malate symporter
MKYIEHMKHQHIKVYAIKICNIKLLVYIYIYIYIYIRISLKFSHIALKPVFNRIRKMQFKENGISDGNMNMGRGGGGDVERTLGQYDIN